MTLENPGDQTNAIGDSVYVTTGGSDANGAPLTFSASNLPPGLSIDPSSGDITGTIANTATDGVPYAVTVSATDGTNSGSQTFNWTVTHVYVVNPGDQQNADGDAVLLPITAGENDGTPVTISAAGLPPGLSVNAAGAIVGTIANTAEMNSPYSVTVSATDGTYSDSQTFQWTVTHLLVANPGDQTNYDGDVVSLPITVSDNFGDALTYSATGLPSGLSINSATGVISGTIAATADLDGPYSTTVSASGGGASSSQAFAWNVSNPVSVYSPGDQFNAVGDNVYVTTGGSDANGAPLTFSASNLPPGLSIDPDSGDVTGTIANPAADGVPYAVTVSATDGVNTASTTFNWTVTHVFVVNPGDQQNADGDNVILPINAGENDGTPVTVTAVGLPPGLSVNSADNIVGTISNSADTNSPYTVTLTATDGTYSNSATFQWTVSRLTLVNPGDQTNNDGDPVDLPISVTDNLGDAVTFGAAGLPGGLSIDAATGTITGTIAPAADAGGPYSVTVMATGGGASASQTFTWNVNNPITIEPVDDQTNALGDAVTLPISATTATGDALTYSVTGLPDGLSINANSGVISGTISSMADTTAPYNVTVTVNDGSISASEYFDWTVSYLTLTNPGDQTNASGDTVSLVLTASDNMGDTLSYTATGLPPGLSINSSTGLISGVIALDADADGPYTTTVSVTGGDGATSQTFNWNVSRIVITDPGDQNSKPTTTPWACRSGVTDNNSDTLTLQAATGLPPGLSINPTTGLITGTIASTADLNSPYVVTVSASDASGHGASDTFFWSVTQLTLTNPGDQLNADGDTVTLALTADGPAGVPLTYSQIGLPPDLNFNTATGVISGVFGMTADANGPYTVTVTAADGMGASASQTFIWNIDQLILDNPGDQTYAEGQAMILPIIADDNDGTALTYTVTGLPDGLSLGGASASVNAAAGSNQNQATIGGTVLASDVAMAYNVVLSATDGLGRTATVAFLITIESYTVTFWGTKVTTGYLKNANGTAVNLPTPPEAIASVSDPQQTTVHPFRGYRTRRRGFWLGQILRTRVLPLAA